jgi:hypothetical protein
MRQSEKLSGKLAYLFLWVAFFSATSPSSLLPTLCQSLECFVYWPQTCHLVSASLVAGITGVYHHACIQNDFLLFYPAQN